ncbi:anti-sigma factor domain-containing protein [Demequina oxidasica]|uniref:anti-sigma factor domain-containing protein n=1 Tax=Demequina oxidasica TaxID=676199 RepID=UPI000781B8ED|nr:anti-sigma factor [Demequina oxidasica]
MNDSQESIHNLVGAYALNAIDDAERVTFEAHLDECAQCRVELASFGDVLDALADDAEDQIQAPAGLADRIGAQIALTPQVSSPPTSSADTGNDLDGATLGGAPVSDGNTADLPRVEAEINDAPAQSANVVSFDRAVSADSPKTSGDRTHADPVGRRSRLTMMLATAAATVAVAAVGIGFLVSNGSPDSNIAAIDAVLTAPDARVIDLGVGDAQITVSDEAGGFAATGTAPDLPTGEEYQLWMVNTDGTISAGPTFEAGDFETAVLADMTSVTAIAVSVEPDGGSLQPTTDPIAAAEI